MNETQIWKFPLSQDDLQTIEMPLGAEILTVQAQGESACIWAKVETDLPKVKRLFEIFGTGHPIQITTYRREYIGTYQLLGGRLVFHVFELKTR